MYNDLKEIVERAWSDRSMLADPAVKAAIREVVEAVDKGVLRTAEPVDLEKSEWQVNEWVKKAIIMYFPIQEMRVMRGGELEWYDKMELKRDYEKLGVRRAACRGALRSLHRGGSDPHALVRQHRRLRRYGHDGRHVGHRRLVRADRQTRASERRRGYRRRAGARAGGARNHRGQLFHRIALDRGGGRARVSRSGARIEYRNHGFDAHHRRYGRGTRGVSRIRPRAFGGRAGQLHQEVPRGRVRRVVRAHHRPP